MKAANALRDRTGPSATYRWNMARMTESGMDWQRLGDQLRQRRLDLSMTQEEVKEAGGPSTATQRNLEGGHHPKYRESILRKEEVALRLTRGSIAAALAGGEITPLEESPSENFERSPVPDVEKSPIEDIIAVIELIRDKFGDDLADEAWERTKQRREPHM
jgi:hypothetical protein